MTTSTRRGFLISGAVTATALSSVSAFASTGPEPYGATPAPRQLAWHRRQAYAFLHFTINTFTDREWGYGDESASLFNPTDFSADQIVEAAKSGGLSALILTAKHHDGFCLWPSRYTEHSIKYSPYKDGKGDIVRELSEACRRHGIEFGLYLSPWDRNHAEYGRPAYVEYYHNQLEELTTRYGPLVEIWFDGANGGDGYYGGARERRKIDGHTYYQWDKVQEIVRKNQPNAVMFADSDMDVRWVGNEEGVAGDPCWPTWDYTTPYSLEKANAGVRGGPVWNPAEVDVSIRPGWFWHADEAPRTPANLTRLWFDSVGHGANLLLSLAPNRRGRIPDTDAASLKAWKALRDAGFATNLALGATVTASSQMGRAYGPKNALSTRAAWAAKTRDTAGAWLQLDLPKAQSFDVIRLAEDITLGVRVDTFAVDIRVNGNWAEIARHMAIGYERLIRLDQPVTTNGVRVRIITAAASPVIRNLGLFRLPDILEEPGIRRDVHGMVTLTRPAEGLEIRYTLDGAPPSATSPLYATPIALPDGGTIKAIARRAATGVMSASISREFDVSPARWQVISTNGDKPENLLTGAPFSGPASQPLEAVLDLGQAYELMGFTLKPAGQDISQGVDAVVRMGPPAGYEIWLSPDGQTWGTPVASGEFSNIAASRSEQKIRFDAPHAGRYVRLRLPRAVQDKPVIVFAGFGIITR